MGKTSEGGGGKTGDKAHTRDTHRQDRVRQDLILQDQAKRNAQQQMSTQANEGDKSGATTPEKGRRRKDVTEEAVKPEIKQRREDALTFLKDSGFFERPDIKEMLKLRDGSPHRIDERYQKLKEAISLELVVRDLLPQLGNLQRVEIHRGILISEKVPGVATAQEWREKHKGDKQNIVYEYNGTVWRTLGEADILVLQRADDSSASSVHIVVQVKTGKNDTATYAREQTEKIRTALTRFEDENASDIGIHHRQRGLPMEDLTPRIARSGAAHFEGQTWGPLDKQQRQLDQIGRIVEEGFDRRLPVTSRDFPSIVDAVIKEYGSDAP